MEFIYQNYLNTTSAISCGSGTITNQYLFDLDDDLSWSTIGNNDDLTSTVVTISFAATSAVDRICIKNHNLKQFRVFYNGATANTFTPDINYTQNSDTSSYFSVTQVNATSVSFQLDKTITADQEKSIGELILSRVGVSFERAPNASGYKPQIRRKSINHKMSDGGIIQHVIADKWEAKLKYKFIGSDFHDDLYSFYTLLKPFIFTPFPTNSSWDGISKTVNWIGNFKYYNYSSENPNSGYTIDINLQEIAN